MCIRDSAYSDLTFDYLKLRLNVLDTITGIKETGNLYVVNSTVSYTHLTLPTSDLV